MRIKEWIHMLENKLGLASSVELTKAEEKITKRKAKQLFDSGDIHRTEVGTFQGLAYIHHYLFQDIYEFAGKIRQENISKGHFRFAPVMYLETSLDSIDKMPQTSFDEIVEKIEELNDKKESSLYKPIIKICGILIRNRHTMKTSYELNVPKIRQER